MLGIWAKPELSEATNELKAIGSLLPPLPPGTPGPFALSEDGKIEGIFKNIGLRLLQKTLVACPFFIPKRGREGEEFYGDWSGRCGVEQC